MASKQSSKHAKNAAKVQAGEVNKLARNRQRAPRRRVSPARSGSAAVPAVVAPKGGSESIGLSKNTAQSREDQTPQSVPVSRDDDLATARKTSANRPPASTKRAVLIGMLERSEGASVGEIGQRLGWLPHTVRAAITGLRYGGREVTRSKDAAGQSVYRLARVETAPDR